MFRKQLWLLLFLLLQTTSAWAGGNIPFLFVPPVEIPPPINFANFDFNNISGTSTATSNTVTLTITSAPGSLSVSCTQNNTVPSGSISYRINAGGYVSICSLYQSSSSGTISGLNSGDTLTIRANSANAVSGTLRIYDTNSSGNLIDTLTYSLAGV